MQNKIPEVIYQPHNEPYLGRGTVFAFDNLITACLKESSRIAPLTHEMEKTDLQVAACQIIPQSISIALSIRELVRQGYLFGALTLVRPLAERSVTLRYLVANPAEIERWNRGWGRRRDEGSAPDFAQMLDAIAGDKFPNISREITPLLNSIMHGKPDSGVWSMVQTREGQLGHGVSKIINDPGMCDKVCKEAAGYLAVVVGMMGVIFPSENTEKSTNIQAENL